MRLVSVRSNNAKGDTIVEVLFAVAVFALVAVGSMSIMNQATLAAERSLEVTLVRQQIDAQAEAIRYIHQSYVAAFQQKGGALTGTAGEWKKMTDTATGKGAGAASQFGANQEGCPDNAPGEKPFIINARLAQLSNAVPEMNAPDGASLPPFSQIIYNNDSSIANAYGIWVEAVPSAITNEAGYVDFHIRACWDGPGATVPMTLGTIVRLYEPR